MKVCPECTLQHNGRYSRCTEHYNEYMRKYMLERYHRRRQEFIDSRGGCCEKCGSTSALEIDHIERSGKSHEIAKILSGGSEAKVKAELSKCQVLCEDCHQDKTLSEVYVEHGGGVAGKRNCKCSLCKAKKAEYMREYMQNRPKQLRAKVRKCLSCPQMIDLRGKTGKCRRCNAKDVAASKLLYK